MNISRIINDHFSLAVLKRTQAKLITNVSIELTRRVYNRFLLLRAMLRCVLAFSCAVLAVLFS